MPPLGPKPALIEKCALVVKAVKPNRPFLLKIEDGDELKQAVVKQGLQDAARILGRPLLIRHRGKTMLLLRRLSPPGQQARQERQKGRPAKGAGGKTTKKGLRETSRNPFLHLVRPLGLEPRTR